MPLKQNITYYRKNKFDSNNSGWDGLSLRYKIPAKYIKNNCDKIIIKFSNYASYSFDAVYIGHKSDSGGAFDFDGNQVKVTLNGSNIDVNGDTCFSDIIDFKLKYNKDIIISADCKSGVTTSIPKTSVTEDYSLAYSDINPTASDTLFSSYTLSPYNNIQHLIDAIIGVKFVETTLSDDLVSVYKFDGNCLDSCGINDGTPYNITYMDNMSGKYASFNGSSSYIEIPNFSNKSTLSVFLWFKITQLPDSNGYWLINKRSVAENSQWQLMIYDGYLSAHIFDGKSTVNKVGEAVIDSSFIEVDKWYNIGFTTDGHTYISLYVDGEKVSTGVVNDKMAVNDAKVVVGTRAWAKDTGSLNGAIDNILIYNRVLSDEEILELNNTLPEENLIVWYKFNGNSIDSYNSYDGTNVGDITYDIDKDGNTAVYLNGADYIDVGVWPEIPGDKTFCLWAKREPTVGQYEYIIDTYTRFILGYNDGDYATYDGSIWHHLYDATDDINVWVHLVYLFKNSGTLLDFYINGTKIVSDKSVNTNSLGTSTKKIGEAHTGGNNYRGGLYDFIVYNRALSDDEIKYIYTYKESVGLYPYTTMEAIKSNLVAVYSFDGHTNDIHRDNHGTPTNITYTEGKIGQAGVFDGTSSFISIPYRPSLSSYDQSISIWAKYDNTPQYSKGLIYKAPDTGFNREFSIAIEQGTGYIIYSVYNGTNDSSGTVKSFENFCDGIWHHIVAVKSYNTLGDIYYLYIDNNLKGTTTVTYNGVQNTNEIVIGKVSSDSDSTRYFDGKIDQVLIYNKALTQAEVSAIYNSGLGYEYPFKSGWLDGYKYRKKIKISDEIIDEDLNHFPILIKIGQLSGRSDEDTSDILDIVGSDYSKIAITKEDGLTQLYAEVEKWDLNMIETLYLGSSERSSQVSASSYYSSSYPPSEAFDASTDSSYRNAWISSSTNTPAPDGSCWIQWDFGEPKAISGLRFKARGNGSSNAFPRDIKIYGSNMSSFNSGKTLLGEFSLSQPSGNGAWCDWVSIQNPRLFKCVRVEIHTMQPIPGESMDSWVAIAETEFKETAVKEALLWVSREGFTISSTLPTYLYLYYDANATSNIDYIRTTGSSPEVWSFYTSLLFNNSTIDSSGNTNAIEESTVSYVDGIHGKSLYLERDGNYVKVPGNFNYNNMSSVLFAVWINPDFLDNDNSSFICCYDGSNRLHLKVLNSDLRFYYSIGGSANGYDSPSVIEAGNWYRVIFIVENGSWRVYINGSTIPVLDKAISKDMSDFSEWSLYIGKNFGLGVQEFPGMIDTFFVMEVPDNLDAWIKTDYHSQIDNMLDYIDTERITEWLSGWKYRIKINIDNVKISEDLTHFPVPIILNSAAGIYSADTTAIFNELGDDYLKIAVTKDDEETQLYVEIEQWDSINQKATLWVSKDDFTIYKDKDNYIYLYYDSSQEDNTSYVGLPGERPEVWATSFIARYGMSQDPSISQILDSSSNALHGTSYNMDGTNLVDGYIEDSLYFDGTQNINLGNSFLFDDIKSTSFAFKQIEGTPDWGGLICRYISNSDRWLIVNHVSSNSPYIWFPNSQVTINNNYYNDLNWHSAIFSINDTNSSIYIDGSLDNSVNTTDTFYKAINGDLYIGSYMYNDTHYYMKGYLDEVRFHNEVLSNSWIKTDYYSQKDKILNLNLQAEWFSDWINRRKIVIDNTDIDEDLTHFPLVIIINDSTGQQGQDLTDIFNELGDSYKKIAVVKDNNIDQLYVEVEQWDSVNRKAVLWVSKEDFIISSDKPTTLYLYFDSTKEDNINYVGDQGNRPEVWNTNNLATFLMNDNVINSTNITDDGITNNLSFTDGILGKSGVFNNSYIKTNVSSESVKNSFYISGFFKVYSLNLSSSWVDNRIITSQRSSGSSRWGIGVDGSKFGFYANVNGNTFKTLGKTDIIINKWYHFSIVYDNSSVTGYLNGEIDIDSETINITTSVYDHLYIGTLNGSDAFWEGEIDSLQIYEYIPNNSWSKSDYNNQINNLLSFNTTESRNFGYDFYGTTSINNVTTSGVPILLFKRSTYELVETVYSDDTGNFTIHTPYFDDHFIVALPTVSGSNALIYDWLHPKDL